MAGARALLLHAAAFAASCSLLAAPAAAVGKAEVAEICKGTAFPDLCTSTAGKQAVHYESVDALTVLQMQLDAFTKRVAAAKARVAKESKKASPAERKALNKCNGMYQDAAENIGACRRAIGHKDAVTIRATMSMASQDMQNCDEEFRQEGAKNPMERFNKSLGKMAENCRWLSNMI